MKRLILAGLFLCCCATSLYAAIPASERAALIALYNSTDGDNWSDNTNWKTGGVFSASGTENSWFGVTVVADHVTILDLQNNLLSGTLPVELGDLTNLILLYLHQNLLTGSIPVELGSLNSLTQLNLSDNQLSGNIPTELGNLPILTQLYLDQNLLAGSIPSEIGDLTTLTKLYLSFNQLSGSIPTEIGNLTNLTQIYLSDNRLSGSIPSQVGNLTDLTQIYLSGNRLSGVVPDSLLNLVNLVDHQSEFCNQDLTTDNQTLIDFLNRKEESGDWENCKTDDSDVSGSCFISICAK